MLWVSHSVVEHLFDFRGKNEKPILVNYETDHETVNVSAGKFLSLEKKANPGDVLYWDFRTADKDIGFEVRADSEEAVSYQRLDACKQLVKGSFTASKACTFNIKFDNSFSRFTSKTLIYKVWISKAEESKE